MINFIKKEQLQSDIDSGKLADVDSIVKLYDSELLEQKTILADGSVGSLRQFIEEIFDFLPKNRLIILKDNRVVNIKQFILQN